MDNKPVLTDEIRAALKPEFDALETKAKAEGREAGVREGTEQERKRVIAITSQVLPGHEALGEKAIADGMTLVDFQSAQNVAEKEKRVKKVVDIRGDGKQIAQPGATTGDTTRTETASAGADGKITQERANSLAAEATAYQAEQEKLGKYVSSTEAVTFVYKRAGVPLK